MNLSIFVYEIIKSFFSFLPILIPLGALIFLFIPSRKVLFLFIFFLGFQAIFIDIGVMVNIPRALLFITLLTIPIYFTRELIIALKGYPAKKMLIVVIFFLAISALLNIPSFPIKNILTAYGPIGDSLFRDRATKQASQILMFILKASIPLVILTICRTRKEVVVMLKVLMAGTSFLCLYGIYQFFAYLFNLPAIYIYRGAFNPTGAVGIFSTPFGNFFRVSSLAGEPKDLAGILLPVSILLAVITWRVVKEKHYNLNLKLVLLGLFFLNTCVFVATFSTAGWLGALVGIGGIFIFSMNFQPKIRTVWIFCSICLGLMAMYVVIPSVNDVVNKRIIERLNYEYLLNNNEYGVPQLLHMYKTHPETIIYGASLGGAVFYEQYNEQPESIVYYLFDYGVIGIILLFSFFLLVLRKILNISKSDNFKKDILLSGLVYTMVGSIVATLVFPKVDSMLGLWVIIGLTTALTISSKEGIESTKDDRSFSAESY